MRGLLKRMASRLAFRGRVSRGAAVFHVLALALLFCQGAHAQSCNAGKVAGIVMDQIPSSIVVPRDLPVGSVLGTYTQTFSNDGSYGVTCRLSAGQSAQAVFTNDTGGGSSTSDNVTPIANTGVGFKLSSLSTGNTYTTRPITLTSANFTPGSSGCTGTPCYLIMGPKVQFQLIKMKPILNNPVLPAQTYMDATIGGLPSSTLAVPHPVQIVSQTCTVTTPAVPVDLGSVPVKTFGATGSTSDSVPFAIGVDCTGVATNLALTFTDSTNPGNLSSTLTLTSDSTASGIGIQILKAGAPVSYGPDSSVAGNTNQIALGQVNNASISLPFAGRYISTGTIKGGSANGVATFTMSYQ